MAPTMTRKRSAAQVVLSSTKEEMDTTKPERGLMMTTPDEEDTTKSCFLSRIRVSARRIMRKKNHRAWEIEGFGMAGVLGSSITRSDGEEENGSGGTGCNGGGTTKKYGRSAHFPIFHQRRIQWSRDPFIFSLFLWTETFSAFSTWAIEFH